MIVAMPRLALVMAIAAFIRAETAEWSRPVKQAGIRAE